MNGATYTYEMESEIRGYHVYGSSWKPKIGDLLLTDREVSNEDDKFAVAVYEELGFDELRIVGHYLPNSAELQPILSRMMVKFPAK